MRVEYPPMRRRYAVLANADFLATSRVFRTDPKLYCIDPKTKVRTDLFSIFEEMIR
jgi:hypothetical protein